MGPIESIIQMKLLLVVHSIKLDAFKACADPILNITFWYVLEFNSDFTAVSSFVGFNDLLKLPFLFLIKDTSSLRAFDEKLTL